MAIENDIVFLQKNILRTKLQKQVCNDVLRQHFYSLIFRYTRVYVFCKPSKKLASGFVLSFGSDYLVMRSM
jgi:hypothetical protein